MIVLEDDVTPERLKNCQPDISAMPALETSGVVKGIILTVKGDDKYDFYSRHFDPWQGVPEDPVTGSTHTLLAPYWGKRLDKVKMFARQCSKRGGEMGLELKTAEKRLKITGCAKIVMTGHIDFNAVIEK